VRALTHNRRGLTIEGDWFCRASCFHDVITNAVTESISHIAPAKAHTSRVPLGLLLLSRGVLTSEQHRVALEQQRASQLDFGTVVQQLGFASEEHVTAAVAAQWACPVFPLGNRPLEMPMRIPRRLLELYGMLPVHYAESERRLLIGFVRGVHHHILYTLGHIASCTVVPCFITAREYELHLSASYSALPQESELVYDQIADASEISRVITDCVARLTADKVRLGRCRDYLWARVWGSKREMDLLFRVQVD
jgi:hypothetical protein